jgi:ribose-phosphate pyrophosphokinase
MATPVLVDDILSSGQTMLEALRLVKPLAPITPVVIAIHGLFAPGAADALHATGVRLVTTNTVPNPTGRIDIAGIIAPAIRDLSGRNFSLNRPSQD